MIKFRCLWIQIKILRIFTKKDKDLFNGNKQHKIIIPWILVATRVWM